MGQAKLYGQKSTGMSINGIIKDYYAYAGENISAGDLVEYVNGIASKTEIGSSVDTQLSTTQYAGYTISAVQLDENRIFIAHSYGSDKYLYGIVCTIDGVNITCGTDTLIYNELSLTGNVISAVLTKDGTVFIAHSDNMNMLCGIVCTISGTTIAKGTDTLLSTTTNTSLAISAKLFPSGNIFIAHSYGADYHLYGLVCTISGTTITYGTDTMLSNTRQSGRFASAEVLSNGNVFIAHSFNNDIYLYAIACSISGTTITKGTDKQISSVTQSGRTVKTCLVLSNKVFITSNYSPSSNNFLGGAVCTVSGTTVTNGEYLALDNSYSYSGYAVSMKLLPNGKVLIVHSRGSNYNLYYMIVSISGTTFTVVKDVQLSTQTNMAQQISNLLLIDNTVFIAHSYGSDYYLNAQIFGMGPDNTLTNQLVITDYETQVRQVTTGQFDGIAKTSGTGGDDTGHNDLVSIWTKENVLELSSLPVGTLVKDVNSTFLGEPVIWKIADKNHEGYPNGSVTLITERSIAMRTFDAKEPNNSDSNRQKHGNNRYSISNIRQWLNSDAEAGKWYVAQHEADQAPSSTDYVSCNAYSGDTGFLNGFSESFKRALLETTLTVGLNTVTDGGESETVTDKVFLASNTEVGLANENSIVEGSLFPIFSDDASRIAYVTAEGLADSDYGGKPANDTTAWYWWLRTPQSTNARFVRDAHTSGALGSNYAYSGNMGVRPLCNIPSSIMVLEEPDEDGCYRITFK